MIKLCRQKALIPILTTALLAIAGCTSTEETANLYGTVRAPYRIVEVRVPPYMDGVIDEIAWKKAELASGFLTPSGYWDLFSPQVCAVYDRNNLYLALSCPIPPGNSVVSGLRTTNDANIREDESFEILLDPSGKKQSYYLLIVNSLGYSYPAFRKQDGTLCDWQVAPEIKTSKTATAWHAEIKIPFTAFPPEFRRTYPAKWMVNFKRNRGGTGGVVSSWSGAANLSGTEQLMPAEFSLRGDVSFAISPISRQFDRCDFELTVRNQAIIYRRVVVCAGASSIFTNEYLLKSGEEVKVPVSIKIYQLEEILDSRRGERMFISCRDAIFKNLFDSRSGFLPSAEAELASFYVYPGERALRFHVDSGFEKGKGKFAAEIRHENDGASKSSNRLTIEADGSQSVWGKFTVDDLKPGRYVAAISAYNVKEIPVFTVFRPFIITAEKYPPILPEGEILWNQRGYLTVNGNPVFLYYIIPPSASVPEISASCFNVMYKQSQRQLNSLLPNCLERQSIQTASFSPNGSIALNRTVLTKNINDAANTASGRLIFRNIGINAGADLFSPDDINKRIMPESYYRTIYNYLKKIDPKTLAGLHVASLVHLPKFVDAADVFEVQISAVTAENMTKINDELISIKRILGRKPFVVGINVNGAPPELIRGVAFMAMLRGAAGIVFNPDVQLTPDELSPQWRLYCGLANEISDAFPIIAQLQREPEITLSSGADKLLWTAGRSKGRLYLLAINPTTAPVKLSAQSKLFTAKVKVLFENREITANFEEFEDLLLPGEVRLYKVSK
jgi:hypothetical protein